MTTAFAKGDAPAQTLITNINVFDGINEKHIENANVLIEDNLIDSGELGVIAEGAYADLILVDGNPLEDIDLVADPHKNFEMIMKHGKI